MENTVLKGPDPADRKGYVRRLMIFLALVYVAEGLGQAQGGLIHQPLMYYLKTVFGWDANRVTEYLAVLTFPWVIKPIYGLISDFVPLFGYRRRTYLFLANGLAVGAYLWLMNITQPSAIIIALFCTALGMAASSTLSGAVMVENGKKLEMSGTFVNQQWLWFNIAIVITSFCGGWLTQMLPPSQALHTAALIVALAPIGVMLGCWFLIHEEKAAINLPALKLSWKSLLSAFKSRVLWVVGGFLFLYNFSPSFGSPLFFHMTDHLKYSQQFIGTLGALGAIGSIGGAFLYLWLQKRVTLKHLLNLSIVTGCVAQLGYLWLSSPTSAVILSLVNGVVAMVALVSSLTLAADYCPDGSEGFAYALLMSLSNFAMQLSQNAGAYLYDNVFDKHLNPLIIVSAVFTLFALVLVPSLRLGKKMPGEKIKRSETASEKG